MKIQLTDLVIVQGHPNAKPGDVLDLTAGDAATLIHMGKAVEYVGHAAPAPEVVQTREPEVENRDPVAKPVKRTKSKLI